MTIELSIGHYYVKAASTILTTVKYIFDSLRSVVICLSQVGLPLVQQYFFQFDHLMREHLPKLGEHFSQEILACMQVSGS